MEEEGGRRQALRVPIVQAAFARGRGGQGGQGGRAGRAWGAGRTDWRSSASGSDRASCGKPSGAWTSPAIIVRTRPMGSAGGRLSFSLPRNLMPDRIDAAVLQWCVLQCCCGAAAVLLWCCVRCRNRGLHLLLSAHRGHEILPADATRPVSDPPGGARCCRCDRCCRCKRGCPIEVAAEASKAVAVRRRRRVRAGSPQRPARCNLHCSWQESAGLRLLCWLSGLVSMMAAWFPRFSGYYGLLRREKLVTVCVCATSEVRQEPQAAGAAGPQVVWPTKGQLWLGVQAGSRAVWDQPWEAPRTAGNHQITPHIGQEHIIPGFLSPQQPCNAQTAPFRRQSSHPRANTGHFHIDRLPYVGRVLHFSEDLVCACRLGPLSQPPISPSPPSTHF